MPPKRKAPPAVTKNEKRLKSTGSWIQKPDRQKHQHESGAKPAASTMDQAIIERESTSIYKVVDNYQRNKERRIMLVGKTGTGKSTLGNAILGYKCFETEGFQMQSITTHCKVGQKKSEDGKNIVVLDTPGLKDTTREPAQIIEELCKCTFMMAPGPHAFCFVIRGDERFTQENIDTLNEFCTFFGEDIYKYLIIVFTHKASMGKSITTDDCLNALPRTFVSEFLKFGGKKIAIESRAEKKQLKKQINELFKLIEEIIKRNDAGYFSETKLKVVEEAFRKRIPTIQKEVEKQNKAKKKSLDDAYQEQQNKLAKDEEQEKCEHMKLEKDAYVAQIKKLKVKHKRKMKSLKQKQKKVTEEYEQKTEKIDKEARQDILAAFIQDRSRAREVIPESQGFREMAKNMVREGAGFAYDVVMGHIGSAIGTIGSWFR